MLDSVKGWLPSREGSNESEKLSTTTVDSSSENKKTNPGKKLPAFDISLIGTLESDHKEIVFLYKKVMQSAKDKNYSVIQSDIEAFSTLCTSHFNMEEDYLYKYMMALASRSGQLEERVCSEFCSEMKNVSISIFVMLSQSPNIPVNDATIDSFIAEFSELGELLMDRIKREETILYPKYNNSRKVVDIC